MNKLRKGIFWVLSLASMSVYGFGLSDCTLTGSEEEDSRIEHLYGGAPDGSEIHERRAYVFAYNDQQKVPHWAAWHAAKQYRDTPKRTSRWSTFRKDSGVSDVTSDDYLGWFDSDKNYARGHIVPFFVSGDDRDGDGKDAEIESTLKVEDEDDACTVYEVNAMTNIAPQYHTKFNGQPGVWFLLETDVRAMLDDGREFQIIAGSI